ncbi:MAG: 3-phosphoglycerate dehydrogenase family protein [Phycisphaerales bacterium]|nr:3-phosphoglycerate dehydrogenase family protein [Phycisphaerales bacterium]
MPTTKDSSATTSTVNTSRACVLIADKFETTGINALEQAGCHVITSPDLDPSTLPSALDEADPDILIVRSTKVTEDAITNAKRLSLIVRAGAGYDNIDLSAASNRGVFVANCPGKNAVAVAELAWALILSCDRRVPDQTADLRAGIWKKSDYSKAAGLYGRTLGIVGLGRIGLEIAERGRAFGMRTLAWSRSLTQEQADAAGVVYCSTLNDLAKMSDVISINVAGNAETSNLIGEDFFQAMRSGATIINTSRGNVIDSDAMQRAVKEKGIRAGLDVFANEPGAGGKDFKDSIVSLPGVYGTHHVGASTDQAQIAIANEAVRVVCTYLDQGVVPNSVNRAESTPATTLLTVRHLNRPGVLAHVFYTLGQAGINVEEMENVIYEGGEAACARIQLDDCPGDQELDSLRGNEHILQVTIGNLGQLNT